MINFEAKEIDDKVLFDKANSYFIKAASNMALNDYESFKATFGENDVSTLRASLARIAYSKNFEIDDLFYFDESSDFHFYVVLYIYIYDEDDDKSMLCTYTLMLSDNLEVVDDFIGK
jgi:hypothetical protein